MRCLIATLAASAAAAQLQPLAFQPLPVSALRPEGWLMRELQLQNNGLAGHLQDFYPSVANATWIGGTQGADEMTEKWTYWFHSNVAAAYLANDSRLIGDVQGAIDYILAHQQPSGWLGPDSMNNTGDQYWPRYQVMWALFAHLEATSDARIVPAVLAYLRNAAARMVDMPLGCSWAGVRWEDWIAPMHWLLDYANLSADDAAFVTSLCATVLDQGLQCQDWVQWYASSPGGYHGGFPQGPVTQGMNLINHGVNTGESLKSGTVQFRQTNDPAAAASSYTRMQVLDKYHGFPNGMFSCDEHLAGTMPSHGHEMCTIVEAMYSWTYVHQGQGDPMFAERTELLAYNALPGAATKDFWAHNYLSEANLNNATVQQNHIWYSDGPDAITLGVDPNYPCCTTNHGQGWPKMIANMIAFSQSDSGIVLSILGPASAWINIKNVRASPQYSTTGAPAAGPGNGLVFVNVSTDYPFTDDITVSVSGAPAGTPVYIRIPSWATAATLSVNGGAPGAVPNGTFYKAATTGAATDVMVLQTNPTIRAVPYYAGALAVYRGALLYALQFDEVFTETRDWGYLGAKDYTVSPGSASVVPWNTALVVADPSNPGASMTFARNGPVPAQPFSTASPLVITATARVLPGWTEGVGGSAGAPPQSPVDCTSYPGGCGAPVQVKLVPFGATNLRMSEIPYVTA